VCLEVLVQYPDQITQQVAECIDRPWRTEMAGCVKPQRSHIGRWRSDLSPEVVERITPIVREAWYAAQEWRHGIPELSKLATQ
jgi:hypothetical protein